MAARIPLARIAVIGSPGAGKSTAARAIAAATGLPLIHLDREHWRPGWVESDSAGFRARVEAVAATSAWVIDGNYSATLDVRLARATLVILFDLPTWLCLAGVLHRLLVHRGRTRPDMAEGCPERLDAAFLGYVAMFRRRGRPRVLRLLEPSTVPVLRVTSWAERRQFMRALGDPQTTARLLSSRIDMP